jgi:hypothetical protein
LYNLLKGLSIQGVYEFVFTATDDDGVSVADTIVVIVLPDNVTSVRVNKILSREIIIYPVTGQNVLHLRNTEIYSDLKILSLTSQVLYHERIKSQHEIQIDIARLPAGIFYLMLNDEDNRAVKRFVKTD